MTASKKKAHLLGFVQHGVNSHATGMWRNTKDKINFHFSRPDYWEHMARTMERGLFDAMFIADELAPYTTHGGNSDATVKYAVQCPTHEPATIVPIITGATEHLGVGVTLSTMFVHPYSMCRLLSSLDHLSDGRVAWNVVSSYSKSEWEAYGFEDMVPRSERYERMEEYMDTLLCSSGIRGRPMRSSPTRKAAFMPIRKRSRSSRMRASISSAMADTSVRLRLRAARYSGRPAPPTVDGTSLQNTPKRSSPSTPASSGCANMPMI